MKALTIKQPYASLIANKYKVYEIRSWKTKYRGDILIHAGQGIDKEKINKLKNNKYYLDYPNGNIVAKAKISDCILIDEKLANEIYNLNPIVYKNILNQVGSYAWKLDNIIKINCDIKLKGKLSFWETGLEF